VGSIVFGSEKEALPPENNAPGNFDIVVFAAVPPGAADAAGAGNMRSLTHAAYADVGSLVAGAGVTSEHKWPINLDIS
jgi:hypothetical protein